MLVSECPCYTELKTEEKNELCLSTSKIKRFEISVLLLKITLEELGWE